MKKIKNRILIITILAVVETIAAVVGLTYVVIGIFNHSITIILGLVMLLGLAISTFLIWSLHFILERIAYIEQTLQDKEIITKKEIEISYSDKVYVCKKCDWQLYSEDRICPNCKTPREDLEEANKIKLTK